MGPPPATPLIFPGRLPKIPPGPLIFLLNFLLNFRRVEGVGSKIQEEIQENMQEKFRRKIREGAWGDFRGAWSPSLALLVGVARLQLLPAHPGGSFSEAVGPVASRV